MKRIATLLILIGLAAPAFAARELDGSAWLLKGPGLFSSSDRVTFWRGHFVRQSRVRAGGSCTTYDSHREGDRVYWTAQEEEPAGTAHWSGVWNSRTAVMSVTYSAPDPNGGVQLKELHGRRYGENHAG